MGFNISNCKPSNLFADLPESISEEWIENLLVAPHVRIERIISDGQSSPDDFWYDQDDMEWVILLQGAATLVFEGETTPCHLLPGDYLKIPPHCKHRVHATSPNGKTVWLAVFIKEVSLK